MGANRVEAIQESLLKAQAVASDEICRQIAYHTANDNGQFDVIRLIYSLATFHEISTQAVPYITNLNNPSSATPLTTQVIQEALKVREEERKGVDGGGMEKLVSSHHIIMIFVLEANFMVVVVVVLN